MLGLGLSLPRRVAFGRRLWTPAAVFAQGEQGGWYVSSPTYNGVQVLWKDSAGTDPVTTDGDVVGRRDDLSGNGNHQTQSTASAKPIYRTDGVLHWLEPDGVDDELVLGVLDLSSYTKLAAVSAIRKPSDNQGVSPIIMSGSVGSAANGFAMYAPHSATDRKVAWSLGGSSQRFRAVDDFAAPVTLVQSCRFDNVATDLSDAIRPRINSQLQTVFSVTVTGTAGGGGFRNDTIRLYAQGGTGDYSPNPDYGLVFVTGDPGDADMVKTEEYLAGLAGVTL